MYVLRLRTVLAPRLVEGRWAFAPIKASVVFPNVKALCAIEVSRLAAASMGVDEAAVRQSLHKILQASDLKAETPRTISKRLADELGLADVETFKKLIKARLPAYM